MSMMLIDKSVLCIVVGVWTCVGSGGFAFAVVVGDRFLCGDGPLRSVGDGDGNSIPAAGFRLFRSLRSCE